MKTSMIDPYSSRQTKRELMFKMSFVTLFLAIYIKNRYTFEHV